MAVVLAVGCMGTLWAGPAAAAGTGNGGGGIGNPPPTDGVGTAVPEPATLALLGTGLVGLAFARRRNRD